MFKPIGLKIIHLERVDSTNNYAAILISEGKGTHGTVILADTQTHGRGQRGAEWQSNAGENLLMSVIIEADNLSVVDQFVLSEVAALSLVFFLRKIGISGQIKWPNDIYVGEKKIAGILIENQLKGSLINNAILGIGLNVNQMNFDGLNATSIKKEINRFHAPMEILMSWIDSFNEVWHYFLMNGRSKVEELYLENLKGYQRWVEFADLSGEFSGKIEGIDQSGKLIVRKENELRTYDLKEISFIFRSKA